jgi:quaternary ammonium compound-resistance protein SugE
MAWLYLFIAGLLETGWAITMKYSDGFTKPAASAVTIVLNIASVVLLGVAIKTLPVGTGYAVWTGIGAAGTAILGVLLFKEPLNAARIACIVLIVAGVFGLKLTHR